MLSILSRLVLVAWALFLVSCSSGKRIWVYENNPGKTAILIDGKAVPPIDIVGSRRVP